MIHTKYFLLRYLTTKVRQSVAGGASRVSATRYSLYIYNTGMSLSKSRRRVVCHRNIKTPCSRRRKRSSAVKGARSSRRDVRSLENVLRVPLRILKSEKYFEISRVSSLGSSPTNFFPRVLIQRTLIAYV